MKWITVFAAFSSIMSLNLSAASQNSSSGYQTTPNTKWQLVWQDDFSGETLDGSKWNIEVNCDGGGNDEQQCYTANNDNLFLKNGALYLVSRKANDKALKPFTSGRINSKGKADFKYGRFEIKAKLPSGQGAWPAFWMLPSEQVYGTWPKSGEIDIMESVNLKVPLKNGKIENTVHGTLHYGHDWPNNVYSGKAFDFGGKSNPADGFHLYSVEWEEGEIRWYVDNILYARQKQTQLNENGKFAHQGWYTLSSINNSQKQDVLYSKAPFDQAFHLILNFAVGGNWPENTGQKGVDANAFDENNPFIIEYVKAYQCQADKHTGKGCASLPKLKSSLDKLLVNGKAPTM